jgi:ABC-2 type transport system permease protein
MLRYLRLLAVFYQTSIQTDLEYRADFFTRFIASLLGLATTVGSLAIAYQYVGQIKGWTFPQALVLTAIYYLMDGLIEMFIAPNMRDTMTRVHEGTLDFVLVKPVNSQFMASFRSVNVWRVGNVLVGIGLSTWTIQRLSLEVRPESALLFALTAAAGLAIIYSFWLVLVTLTFWFVRIDNLEQVIWQAFETGRYPVEIYPAWLRMVLTYLIPVVFIITVPANALAGRIGMQAAVVAVPVAAAALLAASLFWRFGLRHYTGASA